MDNRNRPLDFARTIPPEGLLRCAACPRSPTCCAELMARPTLWGSPRRGGFTCFRMRSRAIVGAVSLAAAMLFGSAGHSQPQPIRRRIHPTSPLHRLLATSASRTTISDSNFATTIAHQCARPRSRIADTRFIVPAAAEHARGMLGGGKHLTGGVAFSAQHVETVIIGRSRRFAASLDRCFVVRRPGGRPGTGRLVRRMDISTDAMLGWYVRIAIALLASRSIRCTLYSREFRYRQLTRRWWQLFDRSLADRADPGQ